MFDSLLIANRGEIACRILQTAKRLGIHTTAVYSDADRDALHVRTADRAIHIGAAPVTDSYLDGTKILTLASELQIEAIHPGYGFLSENADFSSACVAAGITFVGPSAGSIRAMGSKSAAKALMSTANVPLIPGYHGADQNPDILRQAAIKCGYPIMLKASAGGGGKGMRIVRHETEFPDALAAVKRESLASFGDDRILLERYMQNPRHIEMQIFGDNYGNYVHLFERDCSIQRRHQKIVEEAPAAGMTAERRRLMGDAAIAAARAIDYSGAGTIEFIVDEQEQFYFMEMNTRLQVEHPVTEMITGTDLVEWQLRVAAGEELPATQTDLIIDGHSIEVRIYAEDTDNGFLPASGPLVLLEFPAATEDLRLETGVATGDVVSVYYDPMIAKMVSHGGTREQAIERLSRALSQTRILGVTTNILYLERILRSAPYRKGNVNTGFIEQYANTLATPALPPEKQASIEALAAAAGGLYLLEADSQTIPAHTPAHSPSAWNCYDGWRLNSSASTVLTLACTTPGCAIPPDNSALIRLKLDRQLQSYRLNVKELTFHVTGVTVSDRKLSFKIDQKTEFAEIVRHGLMLYVYLHRTQYCFRIIEQHPVASHAYAGSSDMRSPMPGKVIKVLVQAGDKVSTGDPVLILEAMKMEHTITAPCAGVIATVFYHEGDRVDANANLLSMTKVETPD